MSSQLKLCTHLRAFLKQFFQRNLFEIQILGLRNETDMMKQTYSCGGQRTCLVCKDKKVNNLKNDTDLILNSADLSTLIPAYNYVRFCSNFFTNFWKFITLSFFCKQSFISNYPSDNKLLSMVFLFQSFFIKQL